MNVDQILDRAKEATGSESDRALSRHLGLSYGAVSNWRRGYSHPDTVTCERLAGITGIPLAKVLGVVGEARAISRDEKAVWRKLAATATLLLIVLVPALNPAPAYAPDPSIDGPENMHYAKWRRWLGRFLHRLALALNRGNRTSALLA